MKWVTEPGNGSRNDVMCLFSHLENKHITKRVWPYWPASTISYRAKTNEWNLLLSGSNFVFLWVDKLNRKLLRENLSQSVQIIFFLNAIWRHLWTLGLTFLKRIISTPWENLSGKTLYFAYLLTKRENLSHSEAKFICRFLLCMKWAWQASVATPLF